MVFLRVISLLLSGVLITSSAAFAEADRTSPATPAGSVEGNRVYIDLLFSTWHPRGRSMSQIAPSLRVKLAAAGFAVVPDQADPHDLTLHVSYREERGKQYRFDTFGTKITCAFLLQPISGETLLDLTIREESSD